MSEAECQDDSQRSGAPPKARWVGDEAKAMQRPGNREFISLVV